MTSGGVYTMPARCRDGKPAIMAVFTHPIRRTMPYGASLRLAIITGAASGLGRAFCRQVIARPGNWHIVAVDVDEEGARQTLTEICQEDRVDAQCERFDVTDGHAWQDLRQRLQQDWPRLDLLVNNAGVCMSAEVGDGDLAAWRRVMEVNYLGVLNGCHVMAPWMKKSAAIAGLAPNPVTPSPIPVTPRYSEGSTPPPNPAIINIASIMAIIPAPSLGAYCASKAAVVALTEAMYAELRPHAVNVTVAVPGFFPTSLLDNGVFASRRHRDQADQWVRTSTIDADLVARESLQATDRGQLYAVMGRRARWYWRLKRVAPTMLLNVLSRRYDRMMRDAEDAVAAD